MGLKDFFSFRWLLGQTSTEASAVSRTQQGGGDMSTQGGRGMQRLERDSVFAGEVSPNKTFPTLIWAFFYTVLIVMVVVALVGWRADLFLKGIGIIATIFALVLAFLFGLVALFWNYVSVLSLWQVIQVVIETIKGGEIQPGKLKAIGMGFILILCFIGFTSTGLYMTYSVLFTPQNSISLMFNQVQQPSSTVQQASTASSLFVSTDSHVVRKGDTIAKVAKKYSTTVEAIKETNFLTTDVLKVGQILILP